MKVFKATHGNKAWKRKQSETGKTWRQTISGSLPPFAKKVGHFEKGQLLIVPLDRNGELSEGFGNAYTKKFFRVTSVMSNGQVEMKMAEVKAPDAGGATWSIADLSPACYMRAPKSSSKLAMLLSGE